MTMKITVFTEYHCNASMTIDLGSHTWADVESWGIKWDTLHTIFKDGTTGEFELYSDPSEGIDWKRPSHIDIEPHAGGE